MFDGTSDDAAGRNCKAKRGASSLRAAMARLGLLVAVVAAVQAASSSGV